MVFRKPYGFLIKHFKLIHLVITAILAYLISCNNKLYTYLNDCIADSVNRYNSLNYINYNIFILIVLVIGLFLAIYWLFRYKDKPNKLYILSIGGYIIVGIFIFLLFNYFTELHSSVMNQKTIRAYRDIMLIILGFQYIITIIMFIRGLGFDIKKFNFSKDMHDLGLSDEDGEEIEVSVKIDSDVVLRGVRKKKRELGYFFQEYKIIILGIFSILLVIVGYNAYNYLSNYFKVYNHNEVVGNEYFINVLNSYYDIDEDKNYIIVSFDIYKYGKRGKLNINNLVLKVDKKEYLPNKNICFNYDYIGNCYKQQYVSKDTKNYILVYKVDNLNSKKTYLLYKEDYDNPYKIRLNLENYE